MNIITKLYQSPIVRKLAKYAIIGLSIWFVGYLFNLNYQFVNSNGLHGIMARKTMQAINENSEKARAYDTIPTNYLMNANDNNF
jgi:hypothetical protein